MREAVGSGYGSHTLGHHPSDDSFARHRPSDDEVAPRRSEDAYESDTNPYGLGSRKKPSQDITRGPMPDYGRRPSASTATPRGQRTRRSTIAEEDIEVPYGREEGRDSSVMAVGDRGRDGDGNTYGGMDEDHEHDGPPVGGLSALGARLRNQVSADILDDEDGIGKKR
ncbi:hypothetical protein V8E55_011839 [Tylopilus felleus]